MPLNIPGILVPFQLLFHPRIVLPSLTVRGWSVTLEYLHSLTRTAQEDIRQLDFAALRRAGYRGAVFDKDNCLTIPYKDTLVPELEDAWKTCISTFGPNNVLIVSNSAGTHLDPGGIQAESVSHHLRVPVLFHSSLKPAYLCIAAIRRFFEDRKDPVRVEELIVVGDRVFTDVVLANRMRMQADKQRQRSLTTAAKADSDVGTAVKASVDATTPLPPGPLAIWTTGVWKRESMLMRYFERRLIDTVLSCPSVRDTKPLFNPKRFLKESES